MIKNILIVVLIVHGLNVSGQITSGLTGVPDTGFNNNREYNKLKKNYPSIKLVEEKRIAEVKEERGMSYCETPIGISLSLDAFYPKKGQGLTAVLIIHGGGWRSGNRSQHIPLAQHLAANGFACFTAEYRLSTEALYPAAVYDLKTAIKWIRAHAKKYRLNPEKIAVVGFSAGGQLAALLGTTNNDMKFEKADCNAGVSSSVQAIVSLDGSFSFVHPESDNGDDIKSYSAATYWFGYTAKERLDLRTEASPLTHAGKDTPPTLFLNSSVKRMHAGRDDFQKVLTANSIYSEVYTFEDAPHSFCLFEPWFDPTVEKISSFLNKVF